MTNREIYNDIAKKISEVTTRKYSTSFSLGINFFSYDIRPSIYGIYGFVRFADEIVDIVDTGNTLKANGLVAHELIANVSARLIVNKTAMKTKFEVIEDIIDRLRGAL